MSYIENEEKIFLGVRKYSKFFIYSKLESKLLMNSTMKITQYTD